MGPQGRQATIRALARAANVSPSTVSRALRGKKGVSAQTRERLLRMAREMGLKTLAAPGPGPQGERRADLFVDARSAPYMRDLALNPFYLSLIAGLYQSGQRLRVNLQMARLRNDAQLESAVRGILSRGEPGGVIWMGYNGRNAYEPWVERLAEAGVPVVLCDHYVPGLPCDAVLSDNVDGSHQMARHVAALGHRRVTIVELAVGSAAAWERVIGAQACFFSEGLGPDEVQVLKAPPTFEGGYALLPDVLRHGSTAVLCGNDQTALGLLRRAREMHVRVPGDLSIAGFDGTATSAITSPSLTTVHVDTERIAEETLRRLLLRKESAGGRPAAKAPAEDELQPAWTPVRTVVPVEVVARESTGPAPVRRWRL